MNDLMKTSQVFACKADKLQMKVYRAVSFVLPWFFLTNYWHHEFQIEQEIWTNNIFY